MEEKVRATGTVVTHVLLLGIGLLLLPLSVGMLLSYPHEIFWMGLLLLAACIVFFYSAYTGIKRGRQQIQQLQQVQQQLDKVQSVPFQEATPLTRAEPSFPETPLQHEAFAPHQVLARWEIPDVQWQAFYKTEKQKRFQSLWIEAALILLLGTVLLLIMRGADWPTALIISAALAITWWVLKYLLHLKVLRSSRTVNIILITTSSVRINDQLHVFYDAHVTPAAFTLVTESKPAVLEISYQWLTGRGATHEELRVPVPLGKEEEARQLVQRLSAFLP